MIRARSSPWLALALLAFGLFGNLAQAQPRIVSLAPHLTELAYAAGIGVRLVGAVAWSDYPEPARALPRIGDATRLDLERIVRLGATDALAWQTGTPQSARARLRELGIEVHVIGIETLDGIAEALVRLDRIGQAGGAGAQRAEAFRRALADLRAGRQHDRSIPLFYQISARPLFTLGRRHVLNEVFAICGARNLFFDLNASAAAVDPEAVLARRPLAIVASAGQAREDELAQWRRADKLPTPAGRCDNLLAVDASLLVRPGPRILDGAQALCRWLDNAVRADLDDPACQFGGDSRRD